MSLYNMVCGMNAQLAVVASTVLGFRIDNKFPRFRDAFLKAEDAPFAADLFVYTRMGGGNRECWGGEENPCQCPAHLADAIEREPWCVGSYDDDFDCTYRTFGVRLTEAQKAEMESAMTVGMSEEFRARVLALFPKLAEKLNAKPEAQPAQP